jgi:uncharacterized protein (TIRG00374 family)
MDKRKKMDRKQVKRVIQIGGTLLSAGLFIWLLSQQNWNLVYQILRRMPFWVIPLSFLLIFSGLVVNAWRWWGLVRCQKIRISFYETLKIVLAGAYASNFLPSTVGGDVVRIVGMLNYANSKVVVVSSVVVDRVINVISYFSLTPLVFIFFDIRELIGVDVRSYLIATSIANSKWIEKIRNVSSKLIGSVKDSFRLWSREPSEIVKAFLISWVSLIVVFLGVWTLATGIQIPVTFFEVIAISVIVYVLTLLPISVNGYGLREVAVTTLYIQLGASLEQASTLAIVTRFLSLMATLPGAIWLQREIIVESFEDTLDK